MFNITVAPSASFSVDMYFLMDLTLTMVQDLNNLKSFSAELGIHKTLRLVKLLFKQDLSGPFVPPFFNIVCPDMGL